MNFGLPDQRIKKENKYKGISALIFHPVDGEGKGRKMELTEEALDMLNLDSSKNQISFSFSGADIYIVNTSGCDNCAGLKVGKTTNGFSDKKHYDFIKKKTFGLGDTEELVLYLDKTENEYLGNPVFKLYKTQGNTFLDTIDETQEDFKHSDNDAEDLLISEEALTIEVVSETMLYDENK